MKTGSPVHAAAKWLLIFALAWAAGSKLFWIGKFEITLLATGMVPEPLARPVALVLPVLEAALATCIALDRFRAPSLFAALALSLVFVFVHTYTVITGTVVPCGCAGIVVSRASTSSHLLLLGLSLSMTLAVLALLFKPGTRRDVITPSSSGVSARPVLDEGSDTRRTSAL